MELDQVKLHDFAEKYTAAWCSGDAASVAAFFSPNGSLAINGGAPAVGREALTEVAQGFFTTFPDLHLEMDKIVFTGETARFHWTCSGTNTGADGVKRKVRFSGFEAWRIGADGLIAESKGTFDAADYSRQLET